MNAHATSSGIVELKKDYHTTGFYVEADLSYNRYGSSNHSNATNSTNSTSTSAGESVKMMISISNVETMVAESCEYFGYYNCFQYGCYKYGSTQNIDYPAFSAYTTVAKGDMYLDYSYWKLSTAYLYIAQSCQSHHNYFGYDRYGVIGLGTGGSAGGDFSFSKIFSININSEVNGGSLLFKNDASNIAGVSSETYSFYANSTWQIRVYSGYVQVSYGSVGFSGNVVFDINADAIGLPYNIYTSVVSYFRSYTSTYCSSTNFRPTCTLYSGSIGDLPDININLDGINLKIPSKIYTTKNDDGSFYFNFKATSPSLTNDSYVTPSFQNSIILDARFMSYYYTVFDASSGYNYIKIYEKSTFPSSWWINAGIAGAAFFAVLLCCCCCSKKKRVTKNTSTVAQINNTTDIQNTTQAPLIYNQQVPVVPTYSYDVNSYNYAGYNAQPQYPGYNAGYQQPQVYAPAPGYIQPQAAPVGYPQENAK